GCGRPRAAPGDSVVRPRNGGQGGRGVRAGPWRGGRDPGAPGRGPGDVGRSLPAVFAVTAIERRFRQAAWTYLGYAIVHLLTPLYLQLAVFPVRGGPLVWFGGGRLVDVWVALVLCSRRPS